MMDGFAVRIGRVKKHGGADLKIVRVEQPSSTDVMTALQNMMALAERGELASIAIAAARYDGGIATNYCPGSRLFSLIGAVHAVNVRLDRELEA